MNNFWEKPKQKKHLFFPETNRLASITEDRSDETTEILLILILNVLVFLILKKLINCHAHN